MFFDMIRLPLLKYKILERLMGKELMAPLEWGVVNIGIR
jgi:hypothetical protein